ncbi:MAG: aspartate--tRNA ligase [Candidatus Omnitrophota bacterium]
MKNFRTHSCSELNLENNNQPVILCGWVRARRDHGGLIFIDLRDREGITQLVFNPELDADLHRRAGELRSEFVIRIEGKVLPRPLGTENKKILTGEIEVTVQSLENLSKSKVLPFEIEDNINISEELRLKYRYLDLRRPVMQQKLILRHKVFKLIRDILDREKFIEVETPILTKSTPEGARDYLVPSRLNPGQFYALPQSPQLFKQILMVAGLEKYFQLAKCFRDEDLRADRQPEFTQLDIEMSFITETDIFTLIERIVQQIVRLALNREIDIPFQRLSHYEVISRFGTDKPDVRFGMELIDLTDIVCDAEFKIFKNVVKEGGMVKTINVKGGAGFSHAEIQQLETQTAIFGAKGLAWFKIKAEGVVAPIKKFFSDEITGQILEKTNAEVGDLLLFVADKNADVVNSSLAHLRLELAKRMNKISPNTHTFLWVTDFPLFKYNQEEQRWESEHHPFTAPDEEDIKLIESEPDKVCSRAFDLVFNGVEIGSGSIRIHDVELQQKIFKRLGITEKEMQEKFGFLLEAFQYGPPPHGGIALGMDRLLAMLTASTSIREIIAFPKTQKGACLLSGAPSGVTEKQLRELGLDLKVEFDN